ncbi:unnamed protein product [Trichobilharzia szidati]|nr:unnamed protein product [Trichobilharzia szidati]
MLSGAQSLLLSSAIILGTLLPMVSSSFLLKWFLCEMGFKSFCDANSSTSRLQVFSQLLISGCFKLNQTLVKSEPFRNIHTVDDENELKEYESFLGKPAFMLLK